MAALIETQDIGKRFGCRAGWQRASGRGTLALDGVSIRLEAGASLGLVGESGCGKTTLARILIGLETPTTGKLLWAGRDTTAFTRSDWRRCWRQFQYVFQDAQSALNPRHSVEATLGTPMQALLRLGRAERGRRIDALLERVGLGPDLRARYPHELSGGQAQRVVLGRALAVQPRGLILDEPVSALDVSVQAQILTLLKGLRSDLELTYLFISHDLAVVEQLCEQVVVMKDGVVVERGGREELFHAPKKAYTRRLIAAASWV